MKTSNKECIERIDAFNDTYELARWLEEYRADIKDEGVETETIYYLEEIRQNLVGQQELLLEFKKNQMLDA